MVFQGSFATYSFHWKHWVRVQVPSYYVCGSKTTPEWGCSGPMVAHWNKIIMPKNITWLKVVTGTRQTRWLLTWPRSWRGTTKKNAISSESLLCCHHFWSLASVTWLIIMPHLICCKFSFFLSVNRTLSLVISWSDIWTMKSTLTLATF